MEVLEEEKINQIGIEYKQVVFCSASTVLEKWNFLLISN